MDDMGHGTHVAGTIGAVGNDGTGIVGINWNVKILACKFLDSTGSGSLSGAVTCLQYVRKLKDSGVNIVATNNSWGAAGCANCYSQALADAITAQKDILFINAAGNSNANNDFFNDIPANYNLPNMIAVAATDSSDNMASFSDYGKKSVDAGAPGVKTLSTLPAVNYWNISGGYGYLSGTSMATPHVTGLAALLQAQNMNRSWTDIKNLILSGGTTKSSMKNTVTGKRISAYGSLACSGNTVLGARKYPRSLTVGTPVTLSALSINCASPVGPVTVTTASGQMINLHDDGVSPDLVSGDGVFSATWTPSQAVDLLTFTSPAGKQTVEIPGLEISAYTLEGNIRSAYSYSLTAIGGLPPYTWAIASGSLPPGLSLNSSTGQISGQPTSTGTFYFTVQVTDGYQMTATKSITFEAIDNNIVASWGEVVGNSTYGYLPYYIVADSSGNSYSTGALWKNGDDTWDTTLGTFITKYDPSGNMLWTKNFEPMRLDSNGFYYPTTAVDSVAADASGNLYGGGYTWNGTKYVYFAVKYDPSGNVLWQRTYDIGYDAFSFNMGSAVDANGNFYLGSVSAGYIVLIKFSPSGNSLWAKTYVSSTDSTVMAAAADPSGNIYLSGDAFWVDSSNQYRTDLLTIKFDSSGNQIWALRYNDGNQGDYVHGISTDSTGVYLSGYTSGFSCILKKYSPAGAELWTKLSSAACDSVAADGNGYVYASSLNGFAKYDASGSLVWSRNFDGGYIGSSEYSFSDGIAVDSGGVIHTAGTFYDHDNFYSAVIAYNQAAAFVITTTSLPSGTTGVAYSQTVSATGGTSPYTWSVVSGSLPSGLSLNSSSGVISGTPTASGTYSFTIRVTDTRARQAQQAFSVSISPHDISAQVSVTTTGFGYSRKTKRYSGSLTITNNGPAVTGTIVVALTNLSTGVTLYNATGNYNGAPTITASTSGLAAGRSITVQIEFTNPNKVTITFSTVTLQE